MFPNASTRQAERAMDDDARDLVYRLDRARKLLADAADVIADATMDRASDIIVAPDNHMATLCDLEADLYTMQRTLTATRSAHIPYTLIGEVL